MKAATVNKKKSVAKKKSNVAASTNKHINKSTHHFPVVAIGASAGGLEAMIELLNNLPPDTGMAFIYVQHLSPDHKSMLTEILSKRTKMKVQEIDDMDKIKPDNVFVIPYNKGIEVTDGHIKLIPRSASSTAISIDILFSSLAHAQKERVIGIVLSGSASDGTVGIKDIKHEGGLTFAQDDTAKFTSMPHSAIAAGVVDFILSPKEIALELARLSKHPLIKTIGEKNGEEDLTDNSSPALKIILNQLHKATGVDFSAYKMNTIKRRIIRRMLLYNIPNLKEYAKLLAQKNEETDILYQDLLINVTSFFRDTDTHKYLKESLFPKLLKRKKPGGSLRIWVPACATGEEAYSIAMMLLEIQGSQTSITPVQIFATDLSESAIAKARIGVYTKQELETVSPKRIQRFFTKVEGSFRVNKAVRDLCVFAPHNILRDPPFSRLDFISCCNLFIYFDTAAQKKAVNTFHYALNNDGFLMLGKSENISQSANLFTSSNKKYKIFSRKINSVSQRLPELSPRFEQQTVSEKNVPLVKRNKTQQNISVNHQGLDNAIDAVLVSEFMPASVVINHRMEIVQFRGTTDLFLTHPKGKATFDILKMARPEIAFELRNTISKVIKTKHRIRKSGIEVKINSAVRIISLEIVPLKIEWNEPLLLILFTEQEQAETSFLNIPSGGRGAKSPAKDRRIKKLERELAAAHADALAIAQEQEAFTEELQSANEEVVSGNEELQTVNEELETSKEEIESANEELTTTNQELQTRNDLLNESYEYSKAIVSTMHDPMLVLGKDLRVKSANKAFYKQFAVREEETEGVLVYELGNKQWDIPKLRELLETIIPKNSNFHDFEVAHTFETIGKKIMLLNASGIIQKAHREQLILLSMVDLTEVRKLVLANVAAEKRILRKEIETEQKLKETSEEKQKQLQNIFLNAPAALAIFEGNEHKYILANKSYEKLTKRKAKDLLGKSIHEVFPELKGTGTFELFDNVLETGETFTDPEYAAMIDLYNEGAPRQCYFNFSMEPLKNDSGKIYAVMVMSYDITEQVEARKKIEESEKQQAFLLKLSDALRPLDNPVDIEEAVTKTAMDFMDADRCHYSTIEEDNVIILGDAVRGNLPSVAGVYPISSFALFKAVLDAGRPFIVDDVHTTDKIGEGLKQLCLQLQNISFINVPVIKNGKPVGLLAVVQSKPRKWTDSEVQLTIETAERTWAAVERAKAEEALRKSEEKYRTLFDSIDEGFSIVEVLFDDKGKAHDYIFLEMNNAHEAMNGVPRSVAGMHIRELMPDIEDSVLERIGKVVLTGEASRYEQYVSALDRWFDVYTLRVGGNGSRTVANVFNNITERKRRETNLAFLAEISQDLIRLTNIDETMNALGEKIGEHFNASVCVFTDINETEGLIVAGHDWHQADVPSLKGVYRFEDFHTEEFRGASRAGETYVVRNGAADPRVNGDNMAAIRVGAYVNVPLVRNGEWLCNMTICDTVPRDWRNDEIELMRELITRIWNRLERVRAEEALGKSEERLRLATQGAGIYWWEFDFKTNITSYSSNAEQVTGASPAKTLEENLLLLHPDDRKISEQAFEEAIKNSTDLFNFVVRSIAVPSEIRWLHVSGRIIRDDQNKAVLAVGISQNITERKQAEEKIRESEKQLRELSTVLEQKVHQRTTQLAEKNAELQNMNKELEAFTYVSSHDLQEPLRKIQTFAGIILEKENQNLTDNGKNYFRLMQNAAQRMQTLIQDLLAFSKLSIADRKFETTDLNIIIEEVKKEFKDVIAEKHAVIIVKEICDVKIIPFQFRQLMHNLISNALKFSNPKIPPHITIESCNIKYSQINIANLTPQKEYCHITITDNGIGFEKEFAKKIFEVFQRLHGKEEYAGTGIGLAIVKKIVENHNGIITATSELKKGTTFDIYIPTL